MVLVGRAHARLPALASPSSRHQRSGTGRPSINVNQACRNCPSVGCHSARILPLASEQTCSVDGSQSVVVWYSGLLLLSSSARTCSALWPATSFFSGHAAGQFGE